jgi:hypothetical protein
MAWPYAFYAYLVTYKVWTNVFLPQFDKCLMPRDQKGGREARYQLSYLLEFAG